MKNLQTLPFTIGQRVESRSFQTGYRGAWFRCEIKEIDQRGVALQYYDYPDEKLRWMRVVYQKPPWRWRSEETRVSMLRPQFPPVYCEGEIPNINTFSEIILVRDGVWKVGDLVDWFCEGAYWSGKITEIKGKDEVKIELLPRPEGEGLSYEASCKDLRPSLEWSLESGWKVPVSQGGENCRSCARFIQPLSHELVDEAKKDAKVTPEFPVELDTSISSCSSAFSLPTLHRLQATERGPTNQSCFLSKEGAPKAPEQRTDLEAGQSGYGYAKGSFSDSVSSTLVRASIGVTGEASCRERAVENGSSKRFRLSEGIPLNSTSCDSIDSIIMDLEELVNRVKWIRKILESPESVGTKWKFLEYRAVATSK